MVGASRLCLEMVETVVLKDVDFAFHHTVDFSARHNLSLMVLNPCICHGFTAEWGGADWRRKSRNGGVVGVILSAKRRHPNVL